MANPAANPILSPCKLGQKSSLLPLAMMRLKMTLAMLLLGVICAVVVSGFVPDAEVPPVSKKPIPCSAAKSSSAPIDRRSVLSGLSAAFVVASTSVSPLPASATTAPDDIDGISVITRSSIGTSVRKATVRSAQMADKLDERWERFSDSLRDESKCDATTGRRMYDNGFRKDGSRVGNPVLGSLCQPEPLLPLREELANVIFTSAENAITGMVGMGKDSVRQKVESIDALVGPSFARALDVTDEDERKRSGYNRRVYSATRAYGELLLKDKDPKAARLAAADFELHFGQQLLAFDGASPLIPSRLANRQSFKSPFPPLSEDDKGDLAYDEGSLLDGLGTLSAALAALQSGGIIGHWEISIPVDDFGEVVTIAVDDDISLSAQALLREGRGLSLNGSVVTALTRASLKHFGITTAVDAFFLDPSTTKQDVYNPTQLLLNLSNIKQS